MKCDRDKNIYIRPTLRMGQRRRIALFDVDTITKHKKKRVVTATVEKIYPNHVLLDIGGIQPESFTYFDVWDAMRKVKEG